MQSGWIKVVRICRNCGAETIGFKNAQGTVKTKCPRCGAVSVSRMMGRRHERCDTYLPE